MGYTTDFTGSVRVDPPLNAEEIAFLTKFAGTRRMDCEQGPYYVDRGGDAGQGVNHERTPDIRNYNSPPAGQPGLWCQWIPSADGTQIEWDGGEKLYRAEAWMKYLIDHFIKPGCIAKPSLPFLQANHACTGTIEARGEDGDDLWALIVVDNVVKRAAGSVIYGPAEDV